MPRREPTSADGVPHHMLDIRYTKLAYHLSKVSQNRRQLVPSLGRYVREVVLSGSRKQRQGDSRIYICVSESMGRYLFLLLKFLTISEATVTVLSRITLWDFLDPYGRKSLSLEGVTFCKQPPAHPEDKVLIYDSLRPALRGLKWRRRIHLSLDISSPKPEQGNWFMMPYPMHPLMYTLGQNAQLEQLRNEAKTIRILFAGNVDRKAYEGFKINYMKARFHKLSRPEIIETVLSSLGSQVMLVQSEERMQRVLSGEAIDKCVIVDSLRAPVKPANWLRFLAKTEFFLCPPGVSMPVCHNVIEAMAVGSIPILNYAEWFHPPLEDGKDCIQFDGSKDLLGKLRLVLGFAPSRIERMRANVIRYYEEHLTPESFSEKITSGESSEATLFVNVEQFHKLARVNERSVILAG